jgi:putative FmdB family regulatory protein
MPLYEYECNECGRRTEVLQGYKDPPPAACAECGGSMRRLPSAPAVQFKGTGWYVTDYAGKGKGPSGESGKKSSSESGAESATSAGSEESQGQKKGEAAKEKTSTAASSSSKGTKSASGASD